MVPTEHSVALMPLDHSLRSFLSLGAQVSALPASAPRHFLGPGGIMASSPEPFRGQPCSTWR